jgi:hypothetical protein
MGNHSKGDEIATKAEDHSRTIGWISEKAVTGNNSQQGQNFTPKKLKVPDRALKIF